MTFKKTALTLAVCSAALAGCLDEGTPDVKPPTAKFFERIATLPVCEQIDANCDTDTETVAEIVAASTDGNTLIYTNGEQSAVGLVDISNPASPQVSGSVGLAGEPTSVAVSGNYALIAVNTSADFVNPTGQLVVGDMTDDLASLHTIALSGQPDAVAVSKDGRYAAVVIENERDEEIVVNDVEGGLPQLPAGTLVIVDMVGSPDAWTTRTVDLTGIAALYPTDPEPEYVDINDNNQAVVTLQENNHIVLVDLETGNVTNHFSAGTVDLTDIDVAEEDRIDLSGSLTNIPREPDGVTWISNTHFVTADEGDLDGGSRGYTVFDTSGSIVYTSGNSMEHLAVRLGHYPEGRSENKGNEPENADYGQFAHEKLLFVASERASLVAVYDISNPSAPAFKQALPAAMAPEGLLAIPSRNLLIAASEKDDRGDKFRASLNIYQYGASAANYPTLQSANDENGKPIPWAAISGLAAADDDTLYAVEDSAFTHSRVFKIDVSEKPAVINEALMIKDTNNVLANLATVAVADGLDADDDARKNVFDSADLAEMINDDQTVNIDPEGIAVAADGGFWLVSEGYGTVGDDSKPVNSPNLLLKLNAAAEITEAFRLPAILEDVQLRFGFEGVTEYDGNVYVAMQRAWNSEAHVRIARLDPTNGIWSFFNYSLDTPTSPNGGWTGLSDVTSIGNGKFLVLERDNQGGTDARIKKLYEIDLTGKVNGDILSKTEVRDLMADLTSNNNLPFEKVEGLAVTPDGTVYIANDNDGVDDNSGETQLLDLGKILD